MDCCKPSDEKSRIDKKINADIRRHRASTSRLRQVKLLLLGAGDSGKSTIAKQMKILYLNGYTEEERRNVIPAVKGSVLSSIKEMIRSVQKYKLPLPPDIQEIATQFTTSRNSEEWTPELLSKMKTLLRDPSMLKVIKKNRRQQLYDHFDYMVAKLDIIASPDYIPTIEDILKVRVCTTGITEINYEVDNFNFSVMDMGGQRSERRKWIFFFEGVTAIIFVLAVNEYQKINSYILHFVLLTYKRYDLRLREDPTVVRMHESLDLFKKVINNELKNTPIILFLNKIDLFQAKIVHSDLNICFPDYAGPNEFESALSFIGEKFKSFNINSSRMIFVHPTCATDTDNVRTVLNAVRITIINNVFSQNLALV